MKFIALSPLRTLLWTHAVPLPIALVLTVTVGARPPALSAQQGPSTIAGSYSGSFECDNRQIPLVLSLTELPADSLMGQFSARYPGRGEEGLAVYWVKGTVQRRAGRVEVRIRPGPWIREPVMRLTPVSLSGTFDPSQRAIAGRVSQVGCATFSLAFDAAETERVAREASARAARRASAPTEMSRAAAGQRCVVLAKWLAKYAAEYPALIRWHLPGDGEQAMFPRLVNLFDDPPFVPVFGKPYDRMSQAERRNVTALFVQCQGDAAFAGDELEIVRLYALGMIYSREAQVVPMVVQRRQARNDLAASAEPLGDITGTPFEHLWPSDLAAFRAAVEPTRARMADAALTEFVDSLLRAGDADALLALSPPDRSPSAGELAALLARAGDAARVRETRRLNAAVATALGSRLAAEREAVARLPDGLAGLEAGVQWYRRFAQSYAPHSHRAEVRDLPLLLASRRRESLARTAEQLIRMIQASQGRDEVARLTDRYVALLSDERDPAGRRILAAAENRHQAIARAAPGDTFRSVPRFDSLGFNRPALMRTLQTGDFGSRLLSNEESARTAYFSGLVARARQHAACEALARAGAPLEGQYLEWAADVERRVREALLSGDVGYVETLRNEILVVNQHRDYGRADMDVLVRKEGSPCDTEVLQIIQHNLRRFLNPPPRLQVTIHGDPMLRSPELADIEGAEDAATRTRLERELQQLASEGRTLRECRYQAGHYRRRRFFWWPSPPATSAELGLALRSVLPAAFAECPGRPIEMEGTDSQLVRVVDEDFRRLREGLLTAREGVVAQRIRNLNQSDFTPVPGQTPDRAYLDLANQLLAAGTPVLECRYADGPPQLVRRPFLFWTSIPEVSSTTAAFATFMTKFYGVSGAAIRKCPGGFVAAMM